MEKRRTAREEAEEDRRKGEMERERGRGLKEAKEAKAMREEESRKEGGKAEPQGALKEIILVEHLTLNPKP